jgi:hypothetical protein
MKHTYLSIACAALPLLAACEKQQNDAADVAATAPATSNEQAGIQTTVTELDAGALPPELLSVVTNAVPGMQIEGAERKEREGRVYYDVEGKRVDGSEVELDVLHEGEGYKIVEIQRDIPWAEAPEAARSAAAASEKAFEPVRVIESTQTDGAVIYELFAEGKPEKPSLEVRVVDGKAEVLQEEWMH